MAPVGRKVVKFSVFLKGFDTCSIAKIAATFQSQQVAIVILKTDRPIEWASVRRPE
jgi:hypothetical protein